MSFRSSFLFLLLASIANTVTSTGVYNVKDYGAVADGKKDSTMAFEKAWSEACGATGKPKVLVPKGSYLVGPFIFKGPCKAAMAVELEGTLVAVTDLNAYSRNWIEFNYIDGLTISGGGEIDGRGESAWPHNQCPNEWNCKPLPMSLVLSFDNNATISGISLLNSMLFHMKILGSKNVHIDSITITAPGDSPNTDGIHIGGSTNISITNSVIGTGDDCISIGSNTTDMTVSNVWCGPGHGISIGSLGKNTDEGDVVGLTVKNCTLTGTTNGVRIKTWQSSPIITSASNFTFDDIVMNNVSNPIIIDQKYCPYSSCAGKGPSQVKISDVSFRNIRGTSASLVAINLVCSDAWPCRGLELSDINLEYKGPRAVGATASCVNVKGFSNGHVNPTSCI